ncbi:MAG: phosphatidate cytidylyltransferase [Bdellovibrionaceae bacterium]|nr:phosphatidate cytidylyltransferase [Pseudobdellovibrionaceae bacterium]
MKNFIIRSISAAVVLSIFYLSYYFYSLYGLSICLFIFSLQLNKEVHRLLFDINTVSKMFYYTSFILISVGLFLASVTPIYMVLPFFTGLVSLHILLSFLESKNKNSIEHTLQMIFKSLFLISYFLIGAVSCIRLINSPMGLSLFIIMLITVGSIDLFAYLGGNFFKGPKLLPYISPNKSISGALTGLLMGAVISFTGLQYYFPEISPLISIPFCLLIGVMAQVGDLIESALKRSSNKKDSGAFLPGHGGLLDRADSLLLTAPLFFTLSWTLVYVMVKN